MKRTERHQLKQDEFVHGIERAGSWLAENQKQIVNVVLLVLGAALLLGGLYIYRSRQAETARLLLNDALEQYHGQVRSNGGQGSTTGPTFATAEEKYRTALASFESIAEEYSSYPAGRQARYYEGLCHAALGDHEAAEHALEEVRSGDRDLLHYLASRAMAGAMAEQGDYGGASEIYRSLLEDPEAPLPNDYLLFELAKVEERAGNLDQARQYYERIVAEHPDSQLRGDALMRSEVLEFRSQDETAVSG